MAATKRRIGDRLEVGVGLISATVVIMAVGAVVAVLATQVMAVRIVVLLLFLALVVAVWGRAVQNGRFEKATRFRLEGEHPGALVERVRLWSLPHGRVPRDTPTHFIVADAREISFEDVEQTVLVRIPVAELGFVDLVTARGDRTRDKALTLIYGDDQHTVQFFTVTYMGQEKLRSRVRAAIGWPDQDAP
ncbi:MAG TPA: hypothetical protein VL294_09770 [Pseudolysinimonas sp.]|nr:hypothetical protein [Pseudolysinimonas sp.]